MVGIARSIEYLRIDKRTDVGRLEFTENIRRAKWQQNAHIFNKSTIVKVVEHCLVIPARIW